VRAIRGLCFLGQNRVGESRGDKAIRTEKGTYGSMVGEEKYNTINRLGNAPRPGAQWGQHQEGTDYDGTYPWEGSVDGKRRWEMRDGDEMILGEAGGRR